VPGVGRVDALLFAVAVLDSRDYQGSNFDALSRPTADLPGR
jgi:hypothetical protein